MKWFVHSIDLINLGRGIDFEKDTRPNKKRKLSNCNVKSEFLDCANRKFFSEVLIIYSYDF